MPHVVKILDTGYINHNVKQFVLEKPKGYSFVPGQATDVAINKPEWKDQLRPFTFTSLNEWKHLEFTIKIYNDHEGVTKQLGKTNAGDELIIHDPFGVIEYKGPGVFIAGGAGITPFIAILRKLHKSNAMKGNKLIFSNHTSHDLFLERELTEMLGNNFMKIFTKEKVIGFIERRITREMLVELVGDFDQQFYVCGPDSFVRDITGHLVSLGASADAVVFEK